MSKLTPSVREVLTGLIETGDVTEIERRIAGSDVTRGVPVTIAKDWVLVQLVDWHAILNGYAAVRVDDILDLALDDDGGPESFPVRAMRYFKQIPAAPTGVDLSTIGAILASAATVFHLVTVHTEWIDPSVCYVGEPVGPITDRLILREISPQAIWAAASEPRSWDINDITQVEFGGRYQEALFALSAEASDQQH